MSEIRGSLPIDFVLRTKNKDIRYSEIKAFWYRKHFLELLSDFRLNHDLNEHTKEYLKYLHENELNTLRNYIIFLLEKKRHLGNHNQSNANKLISFYNAKKIGLKIPESNITSSKSDILNLDTTKKLIKPIQDFFISENQISRIYSNIEIFDNSIIDEFEDNFFPSCIQNYIEKKIEIRVFFIDGMCYSMAIFSQQDEKTKIDFRNYNFNKPNRFVPYKLPAEVETKINNFMQLMDLNTGSLDFILTNKNDYIFLEVNPSGQYGMIELSCFYGLNEIIVSKLLENNEI